MSTVRESLGKLALRHYLFWAVDMAFGVAGWVYGFGLQVQNWWALIALLFVSRWLTFVAFGAHNLAVQRREVKAGVEAELKRLKAQGGDE